jgi:hypothetical protein
MKFGTHIRIRITRDLNDRLEQLISKAWKMFGLKDRFLELWWSPPISLIQELISATMKL